MEWAEIQSLATRAIRSHKLSLRDFEKLKEAILADGEVSDEEVELINKLQRKIQQGEIKIVD